MNVLKHLHKEEILALCGKINMPKEVIEKVLGAIDTYDFTLVQPHFHMLFKGETGEEGYKAITELLRTNPNMQFIWLAISLSAVLCTYENYRVMGIDDHIFYQTMMCFSTFVREYKESFGEYGFNRYYWTYREIAQVLYKIDELEFEIVQHVGDDIVLDGETILCKGENILAVHIQSTSKINMENCFSACRAAIAFFEEHYPNYEYKLFHCTSWLLSPALRELLPAESNIVRFQDAFELCRTDLTNDSYKLWLFKNSNLEIYNFPEDTSLQRNVKKYIQNGGIIGTSECIIRKSTVQNITI